MAKNRNRKQAGPKHRSAQAEQAQEHTQQPAAEANSSPMTEAHGSPTGASRKKQKSFGHN